MKLFSIILFLMLVAILSPSCLPQSVPSKRESPLSSDECPDTHAWTGKYRNYSYSFAIVIPPQFKGYWNSPSCSSEPDGCMCMSDHGRIIPLTQEPYEPERHIEAYAGYVTELDESVAEVAQDDVNRIAKRSRPQSVQVLSRTDTKIAGLKGKRVVVRYFDLKQDKWFIEDFVELRRQDVEYNLYVRTPEKSYSQDLAIFNTMLKSFRLTPRYSTDDSVK